MDATKLTISDMDRLVTRVNAVPMMGDPGQRRVVLEHLRNTYGSEFDPDSFPGTSMDTLLIVKRCIELGALPNLALVLKSLGGATGEWAALDSLIRTYGAQERPRHDTRDEITELLAAVTHEIVEIAVAHPILQKHLAGKPAAVATAREIFNWLPAGQHGRRASLTFAEVVAHQLEGEKANELHWPIDKLARESGIGEEIKSVCKSLTAETAPELVVAPDGETSEPEPGAAPERATPDPQEDGVKTLIITTTEHETQMENATPVVWGGVPPRNLGFTGRDEVLEDIHRSLSDHATSALVAPLHGLGGVGKTQIATEFAYRYQSHYDLIWWIQADDTQSVRRSLVSLAKRIGLPASEDVQDTVDTVLDALRRGEPHRRWLLIYDDASEPGDVGRYLPSGRGHVLITSRTRSWASQNGAIELDVFTPQESVDLVRRRWSDLKPDSALELAERLGHLPLALDQAVAVHEQTGMPISAYLKALDEHPAELLQEGAPVNYPSSVAQTLALSFTRLADAAPAAARLLELCVFLSSHPISIPLLSAGQSAEVPEDLRDTLRSDIALRRAIRDLGRYALVQLDPGRDLVRVHNLVRAVLRDGIEQERRDGLQRAAHAVLAAANPRDPDASTTWHAHARIAPHVIPSGLMYSSDKSARQAVLDQVRYHYAIGDYAVSKSLGEDTRAIWRSSFGEDEEFTLVVSRHLANALRALGQYAVARDLNKETLERLVAQFGVDHEHSLTTANSVGADLRLTGQFQEALALDEENLRRHERVMGPTDDTTIRVMNNLAVDCRLLGNFTRSRKLDETNLERKLTLYGQDDPRTLFTYTCLVRDRYGQGQYREGLELAQEKIPLYAQRLDPTHVDVLIARRHLAMLLRKAGYTGLALTEAVKVHESSIQKFGSAHEHALSALMTLMNCQRAAEDLEHAVESGRRALDGYRDLLGEGHPFTFACMVDVSIVLRLLGELEEARRLADDAAVGLSVALGDDHPYTLCARHGQANGLAAADRMEEARTVDERALERSRNSRGEDHPYTLACAVNLALDLDALGDPTSHTLRRVTLSRIKRVLGSGHPDTVNVGLYIRTESEIEVPAM